MTTIISNTYSSTVALADDGEFTVTVKHHNGAVEGGELIGSTKWAITNGLPNLIGGDLQSWNELSFEAPRAAQLTIAELKVLH